VYRENINSFWIRIRKELLFDPVQSMQTVSARVKFSETPSQVIYTYTNLSKKAIAVFSIHLLKKNVRKGSDQRSLIVLLLLLL